MKTEDLGADFEIEDDGLMATSKRSGDAIRLGDRILVDITDVAILRRTVYAKRARGDGALLKARASARASSQRNVNDRPRKSRDDKGKPFTGGGGLGRKSTGRPAPGPRPEEGPLRQEGRRRQEAPLSEAKLLQRTGFARKPG